MLFMFHNYNTQQLKISMQPNTATENNTQKIQQIIAGRHNKAGQ